MAKSKAQVLQLLDDMTEIYEQGRTYAQGLATLLVALRTEIEVGGPEDYMKFMLEEVREMEHALIGFWAQHRKLMRSINMPLGAYAGNPNPTGAMAPNISMFNDKLVDDSEAILSQTITKAAWTADGGNTGTGRVIQLTTGADLLEMDCGHAESLKLKCESIGMAGRAQFMLSGGSRKFFPFEDDEGTSNIRGGYGFDWGAGDNEFTRDVDIVVTDNKNMMVAWHGADHRNMVPQNGDFEQELGSGNTKVVGGTFLSGEANVVEDVTTPIVGDRSLSASGDFEIEFPLVGDRVGVPQFITLLLRRTGTKTGNFKIRYRTGTAGAPTDHFTATQSLAGLVAGTVTPLNLAFVVPVALGINPRVVLSLDTSGSAGSIEFDELVAGVLSLFDSSRAIAIVDGATKFRKGDLFTSSLTITTDQPYQRMFNELFGRSMAHANPAVYWVKS